MKKIIDKLSVYLLKNILFKNIRKYGKCKISEDKIVCIVDEKKLKKRSNQGFRYLLNLYGIPLCYKEQASKYGLDKPVQYIIEGINFEKIIAINSYNNTDIIFRKCVFNGVIEIDHAVNITFENNKYILNNGYYFVKGVHDHFWLENRGIREINCIRFINDNLITVLDNKYSENNGKDMPMNLYLHAKRVEFINSEVKNNEVFLIETDKLIMENSKINSNEVYITVDTVESNNSKVIARDGIIVESNENNNYFPFISVIDSSNIFYNDIEYGEEEKVKEDEELQEQRKLLLNTLVNIRNNCNDYILEKMTKVSKDINNKSLSKVLRK